jgi:hypothetical protein
MRTVAGVTSANERCPKVDRICLSKQGSIELTGPRLEVMLVQPRLSERTERHGILRPATSYGVRPLPHRDQPVFGRQPRLGVTPW